MAAVSVYGYIGYSASETLTLMQDLFTTVFGEFTKTANQNPATLNGVFIQELTDMALEYTRDPLLVLFSQIYNPDAASGVFLDALCAFNQIQRSSATYSSVSCQVTGVDGVVIEIGSVVNNPTTGDTFELVDADITIANGVGAGTFEAQTSGAISVSANTITGIVSTIAGWDTVNNEAAGIEGSDEQTDYSLRYTREYSLSSGSTGSIDAIISSLAQNANVLQYWVTENYLDEIVEPDDEPGIDLAPHSIFVSVYYSDTSSSDVVTDAEETIGAILWNKRSAGCGMNPTPTLPDGYVMTTYTYTYTNSSQNWSHDLTVYFLLFTNTNLPNPVTPMYMVINIAQTLSAGDITAIQTAMVENFNGDISGIDPVNLSDDVYASRFYQTLSSLGYYQVTSLYIGIAADPSTTSITAKIYQVLTLTIDTITVNGL